MSKTDITDPIANMAKSIEYAKKAYGVSEEALAFRRRRGPDKIIEPTEKDWELYRAADAALRAALESDFIDVDGWVEEPRALRESGDFIETEREWIERVAELLEKSGGDVPQDLDRAISVGEMKILLAVAPDLQHRPSKESDR